MKRRTKVEKLFNFIRSKINKKEIYLHYIYNGENTWELACVDIEILREQNDRLRLSDFKLKEKTKKKSFFSNIIHLFHKEPQEIVRFMTP